MATKETQELIDRTEIAELLSRYAFALDHGDWPAFRALFIPGAGIDYSSAAGGVRGTVSEVVEWLQRALRRWPSRIHAVGAPFIGIDGDTATIKAVFNDTYAPDYELLRADAKGFMRGGGWYHATAQRGRQRWQLASLTIEQAWRTIS